MKSTDLAGGWLRLVSKCGTAPLKFGDEVTGGNDNDAEMDRRATPDGKRCELVKPALGQVVGRTKCHGVGLTPRRARRVEYGRFLFAVGIGYGEFARKNILGP